MKCAQQKYHLIFKNSVFKYQHKIHRTAIVALKFSNIHQSWFSAMYHPITPSGCFYFYFGSVKSNSLKTKKKMKSFWWITPCVWMTLREGLEFLHSRQATSCYFSQPYALKLYKPTHKWTKISWSVKTIVNIYYESWAIYFGKFHVKIQTNRTFLIKMIKEFIDFDRNHNLA